MGNTHGFETPNFHGSGHGRICFYRSSNNDAWLIEVQQSNIEDVIFCLWLMLEFIKPYSAEHKSGGPFDFSNLNLKRLFDL